MTENYRTTRPSTTSEPNTNTETKHYCRRRNENRERDPRTTRSNAAHLCITIEGCGQAAGLSQTTPNPVDLHKLVSRWFGC